MTRSQRIFLAAALPLFACLLHVKMCDWHYKTRTGYHQLPAGYGIWVRNHNAPGREVIITGLTPERGTSPNAALIWGVFVPLALVAGDIWWLLGWRRHNRLATGRCANCGYDLQGTPPTDRCPECGSRTKPAKR